MPIAKQKVIQAYIQGLIEVADLLDQAKAKADNYKTLFDAVGLNLDDTNITAAQITSVNTWIADIDAVATSAVATTVKSKDHPSHGTKALS